MNVTADWLAVPERLEAESDVSTNTWQTGRWNLKNLPHFPTRQSAVDS